MTLGLTRPCSDPCSDPVQFLVGAWSCVRGQGLLLPALAFLHTPATFALDVPNHSTPARDGYERSSNRRSSPDALLRGDDGARNRCRAGPGPPDGGSALGLRPCLAEMRH